MPLAERRITFWVLRRKRVAISPAPRPRGDRRRNPAVRCSSTAAAVQSRTRPRSGWPRPGAASAPVRAGNRRADGPGSESRRLRDLFVRVPVLTVAVLAGNLDRLTNLEDIDTSMNPLSLCTALVALIGEALNGPPAG